MFGCGHDDLLVYDREGRLYKHLPSKSSYKKLNPSDEQLFDFLEQVRSEILPARLVKEECAKY